MSSEFKSSYAHLWVVGLEPYLFKSVQKEKEKHFSFLWQVAASVEVQEPIIMCVFP